MKFVDKIRIIVILWVMQIIAGTLKGKKLSYPKNQLRPTTDKIRAAIFNIIIANFPKILDNASICDIFSGAGAVGIEAISRGAGYVTFIENNKITFKYLRENLKDLEDRAQVIPFDAQRAIDKIKTEKFNVIFLDPPYNKGLIEPTIKKISEFDMIRKNGIVVIEHHKKEEFSIPHSLLLYKRKDYNDTVITILEHKEKL